MTRKIRTVVLLCMAVSLCNGVIAKEKSKEPLLQVVERGLDCANSQSLIMNNPIN